MTLYRFDQIAENIRVPAMPKPEDSERYIGLEHMDTDSLRIRRWGAPTVLIGQKLAMKKGDVLFAKRNAYIRRVAVAPFDGLFSAHGMVLRAKTDVCLHEFLPVFMSSDYFMERAIKISVGSLSPTINWSSLNREEFEIPSLDEQHRIAEILWATDDSIVEHQNLLSTLEKLELSLVAKHTQSKDDWQKKQIKEFADVSYGLTVDPSRRKAKTERPYLRVANVWRNSFDFSEIKNIGFVEGDDKRFSLQVNDVLVVEGHANVDEIGRAAMWLGQIPECLHQNHILKIRVHNEKEVHPKFLLIFINSPLGKSYMRSRSKSTSGLNTINSTVLNTMEIPIPSYKEQEEILEMIGEIEKTREVTSTHLENSLALKKQLLSSSLSG